VQTTEGGAIGVSRQQTMSSLLSSEDVTRMAAQSYAQTLDRDAAAGKLNADTKMTARVRGIAKRLIPQVVAFRRDALSWRWEINVEDSEQINAYCAAGARSWSSAA
jgi:hypothetical protein